MENIKCKLDPINVKPSCKNHLSIFSLGSLIVNGMLRENNFRLAETVIGFVHTQIDSFLSYSFSCVLYNIFEKKYAIVHHIQINLLQKKMEPKTITNQQS